MKKIVSIFLLFLIMTSIFVPTANAAFTPPFDVNAVSVYMVNLDTGVVVYDKNSHERRAPASLTKLMTSLLLMETVPDL
ncbi:MAG: D-alanyl-D-alanine carboxypeptidase, partial [Oscillospiraceae bacterium]